MRSLPNGQRHERLHRDYREWNDCGSDHNRRKVGAACFEPSYHPGQFSRKANTEEERQKMSLRVMKLQIQNIKRVKAIEIIPEGNMVVLSGRNGAGKTTCGDSLFYALG